ncbi:hypothetical protein Goari_015648, partial [Gossypium aridum]|nr:hypothetical protein [Gossypium aridum]
KKTARDALNNLAFIEEQIATHKLELLQEALPTKVACKLAPATGGEKKPHRSKPGTVSLREIKY